MAPAAQALSLGAAVLLPQLAAGGGAPEARRNDSSFGQLWRETTAFFGRDSAQLRLQLRRARAQVKAARMGGFTPFFVLDGLFPDSLLAAVADEIPETTGDERGCVRDWRCFPAERGSPHKHERAKSIQTQEHMMGPFTQLFYGILRTLGWVGFLQHAFGMDGLLPDPQLAGSGVHVTVNGGRLGLHSDFNVNPTYSLHRRLNVFVYLNEGWREDFGGHLELWNRNVTRCGARIRPSFGRVVAFRTSDFSFHGHPHPLTAPEGRSRRSVAMYYYTSRRPRAECRRLNCSILRDTIFVNVDCANCQGPCCAQACGSGSRGLRS